MNRTRQELSWKSIDQLADWMAEVGDEQELTARAEFLRRQVMLQEESTQAAKDAVQVAVETAIYTKQTAQYMLWSVIVLSMSLILTTLLNFFK